MTTGSTGGFLQASEELRDARSANLEVKTSLQTLSEKLADANAAIQRGDRTRAAKALTFAAKEIDAALEYLNAAHDAHRALGRYLRAAA